jgi:hypothetical protein
MEPAVVPHVICSWSRSVDTITYQHVRHGFDILVIDVIIISRIGPTPSFSKEYIAPACTGDDTQEVAPLPP